MAVMNLASTVSSIPIATRCLSGALLFFSIFLAILRITRPEGIHVFTFARDDSALAFPWLVIVPGSSFWCPWTLLTAAFCETSFFEFIISVISLPLAGRYLERVWGPLELVKFTVIVVVGSNAIAFGLAVIEFLIFRSEMFIYATQYHGLEALQVAFLVAFTQLIPEHQVQLFRGTVKLRVKDLPMAYVTFSNIACVIGYQSPFILIQFGWLISWAYLRFFKAGEGGIRGDRSETFAFVNWFPPFLHTPVTALSNFLFKLFVRLRIIKPWAYGPDLELAVPPPGSSANGQVPPGGARAEAERRRAMALKALDQRLASGAGPGAGSGAGSSAAGSGNATGKGSSATRTGSGSVSAGAGPSNISASSSGTSANASANAVSEKAAAVEKSSPENANSNANGVATTAAAYSEVLIPSVVFQAPDEDDEHADSGRRMDGEADIAGAAQAAPTKA